MQGLKQHMTQTKEHSDPPPVPPAEGEEGGYTRARVTRAPDRRHQRTWVPITTGWLCLLIGLADVIGVAIPSLHLHHRLHRITPFVPGTMTNLTSTATVIIGLLLLMLSHGLRRRKRRAWQATTVLLTFSAVIRLTYMLLARHLAEDYSIWQRTVHVVYGLVGVSGPVHFVPDSRADLFNLLTSTLGIFTLVVTAYLFLRPAKPAARPGEADARRIRELLGRYGDRDSLGYFALRSDKNVIWSPSGKSCIGYRVVSGVMLASGDPIGDPEAWPGAIHAFLDEAARHAWVPAVMGCSELGA